MLLSLLAAQALAAGSCKTDAANAAFDQGFAAMQSSKADTALGHYQKCLELDSDCISCQYEIGWSYYTKGEWSKVITAWERTLKLKPDHTDAKEWLGKAKQAKANNAAHPDGMRIPMGTKSKGPGPVSLELVARFQRWNENPTHPDDHYEEHISSPKSATFLSDGSKVYINSLEGYETVVVDTATWTTKGVIEHDFKEPHEKELFQGLETVFGYKFNRHSATGDVNYMAGKPVEAALSHGDKYLWVPYYRRDFDRGSTSPSAVSVIDTATDTVVRVLPTGPIPKYVAGSPDDKWMVVTHWGDNTLAVIDTSSGDPKKFAYLPERLVVNSILPQGDLMGTDRDKACGYCLRGTTFTPDGKTLLVARMGGGGVAGFEVGTWKYLGTVTGEKPHPRHIAVTKDGKWLYMSQNRSGYVARIEMSKVMAGFAKANGRQEKVKIEGWQQTRIGTGARTIVLSPDERWLFAASHGSWKIQVLDADTMEIVQTMRADAWPVGLDISPDGKYLMSTSQARPTGGGNSVNVFRIHYGNAEGEPLPE